jgi:hypothetical protein
MVRRRVAKQWPGVGLLFRFKHEKRDETPTYPIPKLAAEPSLQRGAQTESTVLQLDGSFLCFF